MPSAR
ncbi:hypothetical protein V3C99_009574, partial [Haemonchus contortus]|jgi:hypothetical protein